MNKDELVEQILTSRKKLDQGLAQISEERKSLLILHGEWSVKDLIGHLGFWENQVVTLFQTLKSGKEPEPFQDTNEMNQESITNFRKRSITELQKLEETAFAQVLTLIETASDQELFDPGIFPWTKGSSFAEIISDDTWKHYDEHYSELQAWLKRVA